MPLAHNRGYTHPPFMWRRFPRRTCSARFFSLYSQLSIFSLLFRLCHWIHFCRLRSTMAHQFLFYIASVLCVFVGESASFPSHAESLLSSPTSGLASLRIEFLLGPENARVRSGVNGTVWQTYVMCSPCIVALPVTCESLWNIQNFDSVWSGLRSTFKNRK